MAFAARIEKTTRQDRERLSKRASSDMSWHSYAGALARAVVAARASHTV